MLETGLAVGRLTGGPVRQSQPSIAAVPDRVAAIDAATAGSLHALLALLDALPEALLLLDNAGCVLAANRAAGDLYRQPSAELQGLALAALDPALSPLALADAAARAETGIELHQSGSHRRADGSLFAADLWLRACSGPGAARLLARVRPAQAPAGAEDDARYRLLLQAMDKGVLIQDAEGRIVAVNPAACRILGLSETEILQVRREVLREWRVVDEHGTLVAFEDLAGNRALREGRSIESTLLGVYLPHLHAYRWLSLTAVPQFRDGDTRPFQVVSTFSDVSTLKRQADLFDETQRLAGIGGWEIDDAHGVAYWTDEMYRIHDLPTGVAISEARALDFIDPEDRELLERALLEARTLARTFDLELRLHSAIGRRRWVRSLGKPLLHEGRVFGVTGSVQDITERKLVEEQLKRQATTDRVTGLPNRDTLLAQLAQAVADAQAAAAPAVLFVDLDRFKVVNDVLGHIEGDRLLIAAAERLSRSIAGSHAALARWGSDEFALFLQAAAGAAVPGQLAERIVNAFRQPLRHGGEEFTLTASVGIATFPEHGRSAQQLMRNAEAAMLEVKRRGRDGWQAFTPGLEQAIDERQRIESALRRALDDAEFRLVWQPKVALARGSIHGLEALLRWRSGSLGEIAPAQFVPHAENSGEIVRIGAWVIVDACRQLRAWIDRGAVPGHAAVNVSFRQLLSGTLYDTVAAALREYGLPGRLLELEMTERVLIEDAADTLEVLTAIKRLGVRITIDDFGEGYSSLNYLRRLPLDGIKISHAFMQGIPHNGIDNAICEAIVRMGRSLGLAVTAEGVETELQRDFLIALGTPFAQGFLFSPPLEQVQIGRFLDAWGDRA